MATNPSDIGRLLASLRKEKVRRCEECGREFTTKGRGRYCSKQCAWRVRKRRYRQRRKDQAQTDAAEG